MPSGLTTFSTMAALGGKTPGTFTPFAPSMTFDGRRVMPSSTTWTMELANRANQRWQLRRRSAPAARPGLVGQGARTIPREAGLTVQAAVRIYDAHVAETTDASLDDLVRLRLCQAKCHCQRGRDDQTRASSL